MTEEHVHKVLKIQRKCYEPSYREARQSYINRIKLFPEGNVVLMVADPSAASCSPSTPPSPCSPASSKKRKKKRSNGYKMAGYILGQPFYKGAINDVNDVDMFAGWIRDRANLSKTDADCIYIHELSIAPSFQGQGLTKHLVSYMDRLAGDQGFRWLTLVSLESAFGFWKRCGYILERELDYGGHTCFYMEKPTPAYIFDSD